MMSGVGSLRKAPEELLHKIYKRHEGFCQFVISPNDNLAKPISDQTWYAMEDFCNFLLPFKKATVLLSGSDYPTLGMAMPIFHIITEHLKTSIAANTDFRSTYTIEFATPVLEKLMEYNSKIKCTQVMIATPLDPRSKSFLDAMHIDKQAVTDKIIHDFNTLYSNQYVLNGCNHHNDYQRGVCNGHGANSSSSSMGNYWRCLAPIM